MTHKLAVIGMGGIAKKGYLPVLSTWEDIELLFYSRTPENVQRVAKQYRVNKTTSDLNQVLDWKPDSVFILTPTPTHFQLATMFLNDGMDVYMEKPATEKSSDTERLAKLADEKNRILMIAFNRRYSPLNQKGKEMWGDRTIALANFQKSRPKPNFKGLFMHINEELVHVIDMVRFLCGEATAINTVCTLGSDELVLEVASLLKLDKGGFVSLTACLQTGHWYENYELNGQSTTLRINCFRDMQWITDGKIQTWIEPYDSTWNSNLVGRGFVNQISHFFRCVKTREQPLTNGWDSIKTQQLVEDIVAKVK